MADAAHSLFGRAVRVTIGPPGQQGRVWTGLRIRFKVHKTGDSKPNKLELGIYNLSADSRHFIENGARAAVAGPYAVQVEAGYDTDLRVIFAGRLELGTSGTRGQHNHHHQGADWLTEITGADGAHEQRTSIISKSFGPKTSQSALVHAAARALGIPIGKIAGLSTHQSNHGRSMSGPAAYELDRLCRSQGLRWSIQDGALQIMPAGSSFNPTAFVISPSTGMIGSPERTEKGIKVQSLLQGGINPGRLIQVKAADLSGTYVVEDAVFEGDTHDIPWYVTLEALPLST